MTINLSEIIENAIKLHNARRSTEGLAHLLETPEYKDGDFGKESLQRMTEMKEGLQKYFSDRDIEIDNTDVQGIIHDLDESEEDGEDEVYIKPAEKKGGKKPELDDTNEEEKAAWNAERGQAWREAWVKLIDVMSPDGLNGMFCGLTGDASIFPVLFARYDFEESAGREIEDSDDFRKVWNGLNEEGKNNLIETQFEKDEITIEEIEQLDDMFTRCMNMDEKFKDEEEFEEEEDDNDDDEEEA